VTRRSRRPRRTPSAVKQLPWQKVVNPYSPIEVLGADQVETIIDSALSLLQTQGMCFLEPDSRALLAQAGAECDENSMMVRFDRGLVREKLELAPPSFSLRARNPQHDLFVGGNTTVFASIGGPAFCSDLDRGRRPGTHAELCDYLRLVQSLNILHQEGGGAFEAMDLPAETRHLDLYLAQWRLLDKNCQAYALGRERTVDCIEMACIGLGVDREELAANPAILAIINTNSPLQLDIPMTEAIFELAGTGQVCCITPFTLAGSMSPAALAGTLVQQTAEVLAVVTLAQCVRAGAPVMYGSFASNVDMQSGAPALGTPEYTKAALASGQIARRLGLPLRSSNTTSSEMLQMMAETCVPIEVNDDQIALDSIAEVGPGGHHFGTAHTLARYETAFYAPMLSTRQNFEAWEEAGSMDATTRANTSWKKLLAEYQQPALDPAVDDALADYVARRKHEVANRRT